MKRYNGLHDKLCTIENIEVADDNARKNKNKKYGINKHDKNRQYENEDLVDKLLNLKYKTSKYSLHKIYEPKERKNLLYKIQSLTGVRYSNWDGKRTNIAKYYNKYVRIIQVINYAKYFRINFIRNGKAYYADSRDKILFYSIHRLNHFPINFKITKYDWRIYTKSKKEKVKPQT